MGHFDDSDEPFPTSIVPHFPGVIQFLQYITPNILIAPRERGAEQVLCTIIGDVSLGYWYHMTIHSSSHHHNNDYKIY